MKRASMPMLMHRTSKQQEGQLLIPESYYYSLLIQYMPYRNEAELLGEFNSARDAFLANEESLRQTNAYLEIYRERDRQLENAFVQVHAFQILEHAEPMELDHEEEVPYLPMNEDQFLQAKQSMKCGTKGNFYISYPVHTKSNVRC
ncbi:hypothetical protein ACJJTC_014267 [Scirpophaga incertulas]